MLLEFLLELNETFLLSHTLWTLFQYFDYCFDYLQASLSAVRSLFVGRRRRWFLNSVNGFFNNLFFQNVFLACLLLSSISVLFFGFLVWRQLGEQIKFTSQVSNHRQVTINTFSFTNFPHSIEIFIQCFFGCVVLILYHVTCNRVSITYLVLLLQV